MEIKVLGMLSGGKWDTSLDINRRVYDPENIAPTLTCFCLGNEGIKIVENEEENDGKSWVSIRRLTPRECWRLMGFDDGDFDRAAEVTSNSQLYKQAGNSIVVDVLMAIFGEMLP